MTIRLIATKRSRSSVRRPCSMSSLRSQAQVMGMHWDRFRSSQCSTRRWWNVIRTWCSLPFRRRRVRRRRWIAKKFWLDANSWARSCNFVPLEASSMNTTGTSYCLVRWRWDWVVWYNNIHRRTIKSIQGQWLECSGCGVGLRWDGSQSVELDDHQESHRWVEKQSSCDGGS